MSQQEHLIKVNIPLTEDDFIGGYGEGVWVTVDSATYQDYVADATGTGYTGILSNDSCYYPGLCCGTRIPFEMRGEKRPVVDYPKFLSNLVGLTPKEKAALLRKIAAHGK